MLNKCSNLSQLPSPYEGLVNLGPVSLYLETGIFIHSLYIIYLGQNKVVYQQGLRKDSEAATNWRICSAYFDLLSQGIKLQLKAEFERRSLKPKLEAKAGS